MYSFLFFIYQHGPARPIILFIMSKSLLLFFICLLSVGLVKAQNVYDVSAMGTATGALGTSPIECTSSGDTWTAYAKIFTGGVFKTVAGGSTGAYKTVKVKIKDANWSSLSDDIKWVRLKGKFANINNFYVEGNYHAGLTSDKWAAQWKQSATSTLTADQKSGNTVTVNIDLTQAGCGIANAGTGSQYSGGEEVFLMMNCKDATLDQELFTLESITTYTSQPLDPPTSIVVSPVNTTMMVGKKVSLVVTPTPQNATATCTYLSSDASIASVNSAGIVTAIAEGAVTVTATSIADPNISTTAIVNVTPIDIHADMVYANFENGKGNASEVWGGWNGAGTPAPVTTVVDNPSATGNSSAKVLQVESCTQWASVVCKAIDVNKYNKVKFKVYADVDYADFSFELGLNVNGTDYGKRNTSPAGLVRQTWTNFEYDLDYPVDNPAKFFIKLGSAGSAAAPGYKFYIDDITFIAGDASSFVPVTSVTAVGSGSKTEISVDNGSLQMESTISPSDATNKKVIWSVNDNNLATITADGLLTAIRNGTVNVKASTADGSYTYETAISLKNQLLPVSAISLTGDAGATVIDTNKGTLQVTASFLPIDASDKTLTWSTDHVNIASVDANGLVTAKGNGAVKVIATANDGSGISGSLDLMISNQVLLSSFSISGSGGATKIDLVDGTLQMIATTLPVNASNTSLIWSVDPLTPFAKISNSGLVTALNNGSARIIASAADASGLTAEFIIAISNQVPVTAVNISSASGLFVIDADNGTLSLNATVLPATVSNKNVIWSIMKGNDLATISSTGLLTAKIDGTVEVQAASEANESISSTVEVVITNQVNLVSSVVVSALGNASTITTNGGTLQLNATVLPSYANLKDIEWTVVDGSSNASVDANGLLTAIKNGKITVKATAKDGSQINGTIDITISGQIVNVSSIVVSGAANATTISANAGTLQMSATVSPADALDKSVVWSVVNGTGEARIDANGLLTAVKNGTVTVKATAKNGSVEGSLSVTISGQFVGINAIVVSGAANATTISTNGGTLQMSAAVSPAEASDKSVVWSVVNGTGEATIDANGLLTAAKNGTVSVKATSMNGSTVGTLEITISGQIVHVSSLSLVSAGNATAITTNGGTLQFTANVLPANATNKDVVFSVNNESIATISATGLLTAKKNGTVIVKVKATDGGLEQTMSIAISNQVTTAVLTVDTQKMILYPTLADDYIQISGDDKIVSVDIYDEQGHLINRIKEISAENRISVSSLVSGVYIVHINTANFTSTKRFIKM